jgi:hypothetical protein
MDLTYKGSSVGKVTSDNYDFRCKSDHVMTDIYGFHDDKTFTYINSFSCTSIIDVKNLTANPTKTLNYLYNYPDNYPGSNNPIGYKIPTTTIKKPYVISCPRGSSFVRTIANTSEYIHNISFVCADYNNRITPTAFPITGISVPPSIAKQVSNSCSNPGDRFSGIFGTLGQSIESFGVYCTEAGQPTAAQLAMRAQAELVVSAANKAVAAKNTTVSIATSAQATLNALISGSTTNNNTYYNQLLTSATQSNTSATQAKTFYDQAVSAAALVVTDTFAINTASTYRILALNASNDARASANNTALYAVSGKAYMDAYVAVALAQQAVVEKNAAVTASNEGGAALNSMASTPDSTTLQQIVTAKSAVAEERLRSTLNFEAQTRTAAAVVDSTVNGAVSVATQAVKLAQAATAAAQETVRASQSYVVSAQAFINATALLAQTPVLEKEAKALSLELELLTITVNNATTSEAMKAPLDQAMEKGRNMLDAVDRIGALLPRADEILASVQGDESVINLIDMLDAVDRIGALIPQAVIDFARNARATIVTTYDFARAAYVAAQALLSASLEIYNDMVATEEAFLQSMVASGTLAMDTIVADAAEELQAARLVNESAKRILSQIEPVAIKSPEALVLLTQLDDVARVVNMAAATIEADILLAQQVQLDYIDLISFERVLTDMAVNARVARELAEATSAMALRARELTMQKIASEKSTLESFKEIEQTATSTVLPQMRMQQEELLSKFAAAEAAFRSIISSSTSVEISELFQTLVMAYDAVNLAYKDILFLYESNVTFLNAVISSNLSFATDTTFQQRASQTLQELSTIKNTAQTSLLKLETYVSNARKTLSDVIAAENDKAERLKAEKALAERLAAEKLAAEKETPIPVDNSTPEPESSPEGNIVDDDLIIDNPKTRDTPKSVINEKWFLPVVIVLSIVVIVAFIVGIVVYRKHQSRKRSM